MAKLQGYGRRNRHVGSKKRPKNSVLKQNKGCFGKQDK